MILAVDVGNSTVTLGLVDGPRVGIVLCVPLEDVPRMLEQAIAGAVAKAGEEPDGAAVCSVVPRMTECVVAACRSVAEDVLVVDHLTDTGLRLRYKDPRELGADRLVNAYGAWRLYGPAVMVVDLGTATTLDVVDPEGAHRGGVIAVGIATAAKALNEATARLPAVEPTEPAAVVGTTTADGLLSGTFWGTVATVDGLVERVTHEVGFSGTVIATGGWSELIGPRCRAVDRIDRWLTLKGLGLLWERLRGPRSGSAGKPECTGGE